MKKAVITLIIILSTFTQKVDSFSFKTQESIDEKNRQRIENIEEAIENNLTFLELKEKFKELWESEKISFFKNILEEVNNQIEIFEKSSYPVWEKKLEISLIMKKKIEERISHLYNKEVEDAEIIVQLIEIN